MAGRRPTDTWKSRGKHGRRDARGSATQGAVAEDAANDRRSAPSTNGIEVVRQRIAEEAARIMADEGRSDYLTAKRKAAQRLGWQDSRHLPSNREIEIALVNYIQLFHAHDLSETLHKQFNIAFETMRLLAGFDPRLAGALLQGIATAFSEVQIQVFPDNPEQVALLLQEHGIPYEEASRRLRFGGEQQETVPAFRFLAGDTPVEISVLPLPAAREAPLSPVDARPMKRANLKEVERLLKNATPPHSAP